MSLIDQPTDVRSGEELDATALDPYLKRHIHHLVGEPTIRQFPGGASNLTYELAYENTVLILRRPPFGTTSSGAHDMVREAQLLRNLQHTFPYVPHVYLICEDDDVIGAKFYVMAALKGIILRKELPEELEFKPATTRSLCEAFLDRMLTLHAIPIKESGLDYLSKGTGYVERQIVGWTRRFRKAKTPDVPDYINVINWLHEYVPEDVGHCMIHNDYRFDNCVLDPQEPTSIIGILDWELATIGDPLMDLGNTLAYWIEPNDPPPMHLMRQQPTTAPGMMTRDEVIEYYLKNSPYEIEDFTFYRIYGLFRVAVIIQQIYYRFYHGQTSDERFETFGSLVTFIQSQIHTELGM